MTRCRRCDWETVGDDLTRAQEQEQLAEHAASSGHPLCLLCPNSLTGYEPRVCEKCLTDTRSTLSAIVELYALLPAELGHLRGTDYDRARGGADGRPLPGGDPLVLLAPGGTGRSHDPYVHRDDDPPSVAHTLGTWEDDWRHTRGEPASENPATVIGAAGYLERHTRWASVSHDAFDEYTHDLDRLHHALQRASGRSEQPLRAEAACFDCGKPTLVREVTDDGYADEWSCRTCKRVYTWPEYMLALRAKLEREVAG